MRTILLSLFLLGACAPPDDAAPPPPPDAPSWCEDGATWNVYDPSRDAPLSTYPDDRWLEPDPSTGTGLRFTLSSADEAVLSELPPQWWPVVDSLAEGDGWGTTAGVVFRFAGGVDPTTLTDDAVAIVAFEPSGPVRIGVDVEVSSFPNTVILRPRRPLPPATQAAAAILSGARGEDGGCIRPPPALRELLAPGDPAPDLAPRYQQAMDALGVGPADVAAMTVFTTSSMMRQSLAVAEDIAQRTYAPTAPLSCTTLGDGRVRCDGYLTAMDYRGPEGRIPFPFDATPQASYELPLAIWLPGPLQDGPYAAALTGHGLGSDRNEGNTWSREGLAAAGFAVVSTDAVLHGQHPSRPPTSSMATNVVHFFGLGYGAYTFKAARTRDNFRQTAWDRLQILQAILQGLDVDGDGQADVVADPVVYGGASLGGMMGTEIMALSPEIEGGLLQIAGGRLGSVIGESELFSAVMAALVPSDYDPEVIRRAMPLFQAVLDPGDPMSWGRWVVQDRLVGDAAHPPQVLAQYGLNDTTVNNSANRNHASSLGLPIVGRELWPMPELEVVPGPLQGNLVDGGTGGVVLLDLVTDRNNPGVNPHPVRHSELPTSYEALVGWRPFFAALRAREPAIIEDPYAD